MAPLSRGEYLGPAILREEAGPILFSLCSYEPELRHPDHTHEDPGLFVLLSGDHLETRPGGQLYQPRLSALWHGTRTLHSTEVGPRGMRGLNISFCGEWFRRYQMAEGAFAHLPIYDSPMVRVETLRVLSALGRDSRALEMAAVDLLQHCYHEVAWSDRPTWLSWVRERLHAEYESPPRTTELAENAAVHPVYLARAFRRAFGCTMSAYLQMRRVHVAADKLADGEGSGTVAAETGYSDQSHMIRQFRRWVGATPARLQAAMNSAEV